MKKILVGIILVLISNLLIASEYSSQHLPPLNSDKTLEVYNNETERGREYYVFCDTLDLEYEVEAGYEVYGFVRTIASDEIEPDLNIYLDSTLSMLLSVLVDKSVKYTSDKYPELSRAKKVYITPQKESCKIRLTTSSKNPLMIRMYKKKATLLNKNESQRSQDLRI
jgi:hypothetical protein